MGNDQSAAPVATRRPPSAMERFPAEVIHRIAMFGPPSTLSAFAQLTRSYRKECDGELFWQLRLAQAVLGALTRRRRYMDAHNIDDMAAVREACTTRHRGQMAALHALASASYRRFRNNMAQKGQNAANKWRALQTMAFLESPASPALHAVQPLKRGHGAAPAAGGSGETWKGRARALLSREYEVTLFYDRAVPRDEAVEAIRRATDRGFLGSLWSALRIGNVLVGGDLVSGVVFKGPYVACRRVIDRFNGLLACPDGTRIVRTGLLAMIFDDGRPSDGSSAGWMAVKTTRAMDVKLHFPKRGSNGRGRAYFAALRRRITRHFAEDKDLRTRAARFGNPTATGVELLTFVAGNAPGIPYSHVACALAATCTCKEVEPHQGEEGYWFALRDDDDANQHLRSDDECARLLRAFEEFSIIDSGELPQHRALGSLQSEYFHRFITHGRMGDQSLYHQSIIARRKKLFVARLAVWMASYEESRLEEEDEDSDSDDEAQGASSDGRTGVAAGIV